MTAVPSAVRTFPLLQINNMQNSDHKAIQRSTEIISNCIISLLMLLTRSAHLAPGWCDQAL